MRNAFILALLLSLPSLCGAQAGVAQWDKARDYLNCKLCLQAIKEKVREHTDSTLPAKYARVGPELEAVTVDAPLSKAKLEDLLGGFQSVVRKLTEPIGGIDPGPMAKMPDSKGVTMLMDSVFDIVRRGYGQEYAAIDKAWRAPLTETISKMLIPAGGAVAAADSPKRNPVVAKPQENPAEVRKSGGFDVWVLLPLVLIVVGGVWVYRKLEHLSEQMQARKREFRSINENYFKDGGNRGKGVDRKEIEKMIADSRVLGDLSQAISSLQKRVSELEGRLTAARTGLREAGQQMAKETGPGAMREGGQGGTRSEPGRGEPARPADIFYMAGPVNNYFPNSAKSLTRDNTVYQFKVSANQQEAEFELHTLGAPVVEIIRSAQSYIKPACDEENLPHNNVRNIVTLKKGRAVLEGDKWLIKNKALIRYE
jgi:hypothetical protein